MTFEQLADRMRSLGFHCFFDAFEEGDTRLIVTKYRATAGNHLANAGGTVKVDGPDGEPVAVAIDEPSPIIWERDGRYEWFVAACIPTSRGAYEKKLTTVEEVYAELLHYFFDPDSPMRVEDGFVAGPGRPAGV